jgi:hypothetical protein
MKLFIFLCSILMISDAALSEDHESLAHLFKSQHHEAYLSGQCGDNILNFFRKVKAEGLELENLSMVVIENKGLSGFGMVNAEAARDSIRGAPVSSEKNWYHHVIAVDSQGFVYDFDFTESPQVIHLKNYAETMFLNETECTEGGGSGDFCIGRNDKLNDYYFQIIPAKLTINGEEPDSSKVVNFKTFLHDWKTLLNTDP